MSGAYFPTSLQSSNSPVRIYIGGLAWRINSARLSIPSSSPIGGYAKQIGSDLTSTVSGLVSSDAKCKAVGAAGGGPSNRGYGTDSDLINGEGGDSEPVVFDVPSEETGGIERPIPPSAFSLSAWRLRNSSTLTRAFCNFFRSRSRFFRFPKHFEPRWCAMRFLGPAKLTLISVWQSEHFCLEAAVYFRF